MGPYCPKYSALRRTWGEGGAGAGKGGGSGRGAHRRRPPSPQGTHVFEGNRRREANDVNEVPLNDADVGKVLARSGRVGRPPVRRLARRGRTGPAALAPAPGAGAAGRPSLPSAIPASCSARALHLGGGGVFDAARGRAAATIRAPSFFRMPGPRRRARHRTWRWGPRRLWSRPSRRTPCGKWGTSCRLLAARGGSTRGKSAAAAGGARGEPGARKCGLRRGGPAGPPRASRQRRGEPAPVACSRPTPHRPGIRRGTAESCGPWRPSPQHTAGTRSPRGGPFLAVDTPARAHDLRCATARNRFRCSTGREGARQCPHERR